MNAGIHMRFLPSHRLQHSQGVGGHKRRYFVKNLKITSVHGRSFEVRFTTE